MGIPAPSNRWRWGVTNWVLPLARRVREKLRPRFDDPFDDSEPEREEDSEDELEVEHEESLEGRKGGPGGRSRGGRDEYLVLILCR